MQIDLCTILCCHFILQYENTPLKLAAEAGNREAVELLIDSGADITKADIVG